MLCPSSLHNPDRQPVCAERASEGDSMPQAVNAQLWLGRAQVLPVLESLQLLRRKMDNEAEKARRPGWGYRHGNTKF
jgi:hypothetical protein